MRVYEPGYGTVDGHHEEACNGASRGEGGFRRATVAALSVLVMALAMVVLVQSFRPSKAGRYGGAGGEELSEEQLLSDVRGRVVLPGEFDVRWKHAECRGFEPISIPPGQPCNTAPAILVAAALSARACIESSGEWNFLLSAQDIIDCYPGGEGCEGSVEGALELLTTQPGLESVCHPLTGRSEPALDRCGHDDCHGSLKYRIKGRPGHVTATFSPEVEVKEGKEGSGTVVLRLDGRDAVPQSVTPLKLALYGHGPAVGKLNWYADSPLALRPDPFAPPLSPFPDSRSHIYSGPGNVDPDSPEGSRDVLVLGWGVDPDSGTPYWVVQETLGECYGDKGTFKIEMGGNVNNFEGYGFRFADIDLPALLMQQGKATFLGGCDEALEGGGVCLNGGVMSSNGCRCVCPPRWRGARCEECALACANGGVINDFTLLGGGGREVHTCKCDCPEGLAGVECQEQCPNVKQFSYDV